MTDLPGNESTQKEFAFFGAKIVGKLDLSYTSPPFAISLNRCRLEQGAELASAELPALDLKGTWVRSLMADNIRVESSLWLNNGFRADRVHIFGAQIGGDLECSNSVFHNADPDEMALGAERISVKGTVFLKGSRTDGQVRLIGSEIGDLSFDGATLSAGVQG